MMIPTSRSVGVINLERCNVEPPGSEAKILELLET